MDFLRFLWIFSDLKGSGARMSGILWHPENSCGILQTTVAADSIPYILRFDILEARIRRTGCWMLAGLEGIAGRELLDSKRGLEEILPRSS